MRRPAASDLRSRAPFSLATVIALSSSERKGQLSREGVVSFTFWTDPELRLSVRRLSLDTGKSVQELMEEATRNLLAQYAKRSKQNY